MVLKNLFVFHGQHFPTSRGFCLCLTNRFSETLKLLFVFHDQNIIVFRKNCLCSTNKISNRFANSVLVRRTGFSGILAISFVFHEQIPIGYFGDCIYAAQTKIPKSWILLVFHKHFPKIQEIYVCSRNNFSEMSSMLIVFHEQSFRGF